MEAPLQVQSLLDVLKAQGFGVEKVSPEDLGGVEDIDYTRVFSDGDFSVLLEKRGDRWVVQLDAYWEAKHNAGQLKALAERLPEDVIVVECGDVSLLVNWREGEDWETLPDRVLAERADMFPDYHSRQVIWDALNVVSEEDSCDGL